MDEEGYPTEQELDAISKWDMSKPEAIKELWKYIGERWAYKDWGWSVKPATEDDLHYMRHKYILSLSTAGWSGNESIISAMKQNLIFWSMNWIEHRRGGHFKFEYPLAN